MSTSSQSSRRGWIKRYMLGSALGHAWAATVLTEISVAAPPGPALLRLRPADYPALLSDGGSVQLRFSTIVPPLTINRESAGQFHALDSICTHAGCTVGKFILTNGYMRCPCHGSQYNVRGEVVGGPAPANLNSLPTRFDANTGVLNVQVPDLGLHVSSLAVQTRSGGSSRFKLSFHGTAFASYQVRYHTELDGDFSVTPFALTPGGAANQTVLVPNDDRVWDVYVDAAGGRGFFVVALLLTQV
jgi:nitrite reductase/ring-hydroxylating ferredoxin subunit